jgi:hypothetical protein
MSPIALRAKKCAGLFEDLVELLRQPDLQAYEISDTEATDAFGRFKIWAGIIGAFSRSISKVHWIFGSEMPRKFPLRSWRISTI